MIQTGATGLEFELANCVQVLESAYEPCGFIMQASFDWPSAWHVLQTNPQGDILNLGPLGYDLLLLGIGGAFYLAAAIVFSRRDLPAPL